MICSNCHEVNEDHFRFCRRCGMPLQAASAPQADSLQSIPQARPVMPPPPPAYVYQPFPARKFTWGDVLTILGFICSLIGLFCFWIVLCPLGLLTSLIGFCLNRARKMAVAGAIISTLALLIQLGQILYSNGMIPDWLASGALMWFR